MDQAALSSSVHEGHTAADVMQKEAGFYQPAQDTAPPPNKDCYQDQVPHGKGPDRCQQAPGPGPSVLSPHLGEMSAQAGPEGDIAALGKRRAITKELVSAMEAVTQQMEMECMQWSQVFMESEDFEVCSSTHAEKLLEDVRAMEQNLLQQKERLLSHLRLLSQTLKLK